MTPSNPVATIDSKSSDNEDTTNLTAKVEEETYLVEKIVDRLTENNKTKYLIKWVGYSDSENTWEEEKDLECEEPLKDYWTEYNNKKTKSKKHKLNSSGEIKVPFEFEKDWETKLDKIVVVKRNPDDNKLYFQLLWKNGTISEHLTKVVNEKIPQKVLHYYQEHIQFTAE